ncbi:hypothetical protein GCM10012285_16070 [Streptomyces kronopolitis]|uniref:Resolvase/invertase-type recombinase catalytic domain-containing protein n=2 Tax=Streptomyces kronopolitis TaxID=1612435 RepID=A0ABQ2J3I5_9ACTN|nr:hypothetical protein GCM10012285_16070 [Streptomyces kronopolitis]
MRTAMRQMLGVFAQLERSMISARLRHGRHEKATQGEYAYGAPPFGWKAEKKTLVEVPEEQTIRARARELRDAGASYREIAAALEVEKHQPRRGNQWHPQTVRRMLAAETPYTLRKREPAR